MKIEDTSTSLGKLLSEINSEFYIPVNQRKYSWEKEQVEDYYNDLKSVICEDKEHYMGVITMIENKENKRIQYKIIDGQQRVITTVILLCVIRDISIFCNNMVNGELKREFLDFSIEIQKMHISFKAKDGGWQLKLAPCKYDRDLLVGLMDVLGEKKFYEANFKEEYLNNIKYIENVLSLDKCKEEGRYKNINIINTYNEFKARIMKELGLNNYEVDEERAIIDEEKARSIIKNLKLWYEVINKIRVFGLTSNNESNLFDYFESLNTKGLKLSQMDLVRNKLFKVIYNNDKYDKEYIDEISEMWDEIIANTDECDPVRFLKYFYMCEEKSIIKYGEIPDKYEILFNNKENLKKFISKIEEYSRIYSYLNNESLYEGYRQEHNYLKYLGQEACYSFLMYVIYKYESKDFEFCKKIFIYVENIIFFRILCRKSVKGLDEVFRNLIKKLDEFSGNEYMIFKYIDSEINKYASIKDIEKFIYERKWKNEKILRYIIMKYNSVTFTEENHIKGDIKVKRISNDEIYKHNIGNYILKGKNDGLVIEDREKKYIEKIKEIKKELEKN